MEAKMRIFEHLYPTREQWAGLRRDVSLISIKERYRRIDLLHLTTTP